MVAPSHPVRLTVTLCLAEVLGMAGFATFAALLPGFLDLWALSKTDGGWLNGVFFGGYVVAVPVLVTLTDRVASKRIYLVSMVLSALAGLGFALLAQGFWSALALRFIAGIGLAGTYMPGMKILGDHLEGRAQSRGVAFYASHFSIGWSLSFLIAGFLAGWFDWRWAFGICALGPLLATVLVAWGVPADDPAGFTKPQTRLLDFRPVLTCKPAMGYVLAYTVHNFELFAARSWIVVFLVFAQGLNPDGGPGWSATLIATVFTLVGMPASVLGNEAAVRAGRLRVITAVMLVSTAIAAVLGFLAVLPFPLLVALCLLYGATVTGDSASITAGVVAVAPPGHRGATMAVHACLGFIGSSLGPLVFGMVLDASGGGQSPTSWGLAFLAMGAVAALGPVGLAVLGRQRN